jgi:hypothetical protein
MIERERERERSFIDNQEVAEGRRESEREKVYYERYGL